MHNTTALTSKSHRNLFSSGDHAARQGSNFTTKAVKKNKIKQKSFTKLGSFGVDPAQEPIIENIKDEEEALPNIAFTSIESDSSHKK